MHPLLTGNLKYSTYAAGITLALGLVGALLIFAICFITTAGDVGWASILPDTLLTTLTLTIIAISVILFIGLVFIFFVFLGYLLWGTLSGKALSQPLLHSLLGILLTISVSFILSLGACFGGLFIGNL